jgi:hypothetical protein
MTPLSPDRMSSKEHLAVIVGDAMRSGTVSPSRSDRRSLRRSARILPQAVIAYWSPTHAAMSH